MFISNLKQINLVKKQDNLLSKLLILRSRVSNLKQINLVKKQDNLLSTQLSCEVPCKGGIRALDSKFKICSKKLTNFRICYNALKLLILRSRVNLQNLMLVAPCFFTISTTRQRRISYRRCLWAGQTNMLSRHCAPIYNDRYIITAVQNNTKTKYKSSTVKAFRTRTIGLQDQVTSSKCLQFNNMLSKTSMPPLQANISHF
jgi:hypothetical protein